MQFASTMYRLLQSPSGRSIDRQLVKQLICTHDEQTTAHSEANSSILHDSIRWMDSLSFIFTWFDCSWLLPPKKTQTNNYRHDHAYIWPWDKIPAFDNMSNGFCPPSVFSTYRMSTPTAETESARIVLHVLPFPAKCSRNTNSCSIYMMAGDPGAGDPGAADQYAL